MIKETLKQEITDAVFKLLEMAKGSCWNKVSQNCLFILAEIESDEGNDFFEQRIERKRINERKVPVSLEEVAQQLEGIYENLYDIVLYIYHSKKEKTIIEIQYYLKSSLSKDYYEKIKKQAPMLHCKIGIPPYRQNESQKYDVNWELGGMRHDWNMFWWRNKIRNKEI